MSGESLINRWRPGSFDEVVGQQEVVKSYVRALDDRTSHAFLFIGPSGVGKTTLARLGALYAGTSKANLTEVDAATFTGIDDMRSLTATLDYRALGKNSTKSIIIDEAHRLSAAAFASILKKIEEPPEWVRWWLCTTDAAKVPDTIKSRCSVYTLKPLRVTELFDYLLEIAEAEKFKTPRPVIELCAKMADGSPRKALSNLAVCYAAKERADAAQLIADLEVKEEGTPFALAKAIADGQSWQKVQPLLQALAEADENSETVRHVVRAYFTKVVISSKDQDAACRALAVLDHFSTSFPTSDGITPIVLAVGRVIFNG